MIRPSLRLFAPSLSPSESTSIRTWLRQFKERGGLFHHVHSNPQDVEMSYSRSSGPGGQNVNKLNTKATLRLDLAKAKSWLPAHVANNLIRSPLYAASSHSLLLSSMRHRTQSANTQDCVDKMHHAIIAAAETGLQGETAPEQRERVKRLISATKARTKQAKRQHSSTKQSRSKVAFD